VRARRQRLAATTLVPATTGKKNGIAWYVAAMNAAA
jgi:hypothetical protein